MKGKEVMILDATLREGEQHSGVCFAVEDKIALLHMLEDFGVNVIEVGHPGISPEEEVVCQKVAQTARHAQILMHARASIEEVQAASRAGADWVGIWASVNSVSLQTKFTNRSEEFVMNLVEQAILEAKKQGLKVRFTIEDASRTSWKDIEFIGNIAILAGADRISLADTVGVWEPSQCAEMVRAAVASFPCEIEVHLHNDLGLAMANALAAIDAGASVIDATLCGIGERAGIVDLLNLAVLLTEKRNLSMFDLKKIPSLVQALQLSSGCKIDHWRPVIGKNVFTHKALYHVKAVQKNFAAYEGINPDSIGRSRNVEQKRTDRMESSKLKPQLRLGSPFIKGASELLFHRDGPGYRWVQMDYRTDNRASFYVIQRVFNGTPEEQKTDGHVDVHAHHCDSAFIFWGNEVDGTGLICEVEIEGERQLVESPCSIFIPAGLNHTYKYVSGIGTYTNIVLAPEYNLSLLAENAEYVAIT
ncbi:2-isopropylmalate synthase [Bacillus sp. DNRA2]|uniref:LeuA family protein n=1 Tax=Bacillus sp. DNRA2 TaxID=2723053 RepID=UPI00145D29A7|nr:2-isopropylmalate synthase [Bacillus sp. DNRA2]NMD71738.1 2-isopropylmalate synthase [Bacillus sp. DNRA2]